MKPGLKFRIACSRSSTSSTVDFTTQIYPAFSLALGVCVVQYLLLTDNQEKLPNTLHCPEGLTTDECTPGFFDGATPSQFANGTAELPEAHACCPGYFCPPMLTCMMPCPLGSYCPRCE